MSEASLKTVKDVLSNPEYQRGAAEIAAQEIPEEVEIIASNAPHGTHFAQQISELAGEQQALPVVYLRVSEDRTHGLGENSNGTDFVDIQDNSVAVVDTLGGQAVERNMESALQIMPEGAVNTVLSASGIPDRVDRWTGSDIETLDIPELLPQKVEHSGDLSSDVDPLSEEQIAREMVESGAVMVNDPKTEEPFSYSSGLHGLIYAMAKDKLIADRDFNAGVRSALAEKMVEGEPDISNRESLLPDTEYNLVFNATGGQTLYLLNNEIGSAEQRNVGVAYADDREIPKDGGLDETVVFYGLEENPDIAEDQPLVVVEELFNTAGSATATVKALRDRGYEVPAVVTGVNYDQEATREELERADVNAYDAVKLEAILQKGAEIDAWPSEMVEEVQEQLEDVVGYQAKLVEYGALEPEDIPWKYRKQIDERGIALE